MPVSDIEDVPQRLAPGEHKVWIVNAEPVFSNGGGQGVKLKMIDRNRDFIEDTLWLTPRALPFFKQRLKAAGFTEEEMRAYPLPDEPEYSLDVHHRFWCPGMPRVRTVMIQVAMETNEKSGKSYAKVQGYWSVPKEHPPEVSKAAPATKQAPTSPAPKSDDDLPF